MNNIRLRRRILIGYLLLTVVCIVATSGVAAEQITPRFAYIGSISAGISLSGNNVTYYGCGEASSNSHIAGITVKLQRRPVDGGSWVNITSHTARGSYGVSADYDGQYIVNMSYEYRTYVICTIYDSTGKALERATKYSPILDPRVVN